jgi:hypothetical protein
LCPVGMLTVGSLTGTSRRQFTTGRCCVAPSVQATGVCA